MQQWLHTVFQCCSGHGYEENLQSKRLKTCYVTKHGQLKVIFQASVVFLWFFFPLLKFVEVLYTKTLQHSERKINFSSVFRKYIQ